MADEALAVYIHDHALIHGLTEDEVAEAWGNFVAKQPREAPREEQVAAVGFTRTGKDVQMIGVVSEYGVLIIHALSPATEKMLKELGLR